MIFFQKFKLALAYKALKRELQRKHHTHHTVPFDDAKTIALLASAQDPAQLQPIIQFMERLKKEGKKVYAISLVPFKKVELFKQEFNNISFFTDKELSWLKRPKSKEVKRFEGIDFDILINTDQDKQFPLIHLSAHAKASFRIGRYDSDSTIAYDFMIDCKNDKDPVNFINQVIHYLKILKK